MGQWRTARGSRCRRALVALGLGLAARGLVAGQDREGSPAASGELFPLGLEGALQGAAPYAESLPPPTLAPVTDSPPTAGKRFLTAAGEMVLIELLPWVYDRYVANEDYARISWRTVSRNFKAGFGFDSDHFDINQSSHPYQGSLYFEAGRSNGYTYWESGLFALAGSFLWECCMENTQPSINDLVNTTLGGMTRGEVQHRLSVMLLDNSASGSERFWRELGAAVINPVGAISRLVNGDMGRTSPNPEDRLPDSFSLTAELGYRHVEGPILRENQESQGLVSLAASYGDPFAADVVQPFDAFTASIDVNAPSDPVITRFEERGLLRSWELTDRTAPARHAFAFSQEYEYFNNQAQVFGAQMFSAGVLSRWLLGGRVVAATDLDAVAIPLAGVKTTDFENPSTGRNYDYGPGGGALAALRLYAGEQRILSVGYGVAWIHTVNGSSDANTLQFFRATGVVPIAGPVGLGAGYRWYSRKTSYPGGFFEPRQTQSEWRVFLNLAIGGTGLRTPKD